jgi:hypothetical protein
MSGEGGFEPPGRQGRQDQKDFFPNLPWPLLASWRFL